MSEKTIAADLALLRQLFDPPPVLSTENRQAYEEMMRRFVECFRPQDPFEIALVKDIIDGSWEAARWGRHKSLTMHSRYLARLEFQARQRKAAAQQKAELKKRRAASKADPPTEPEEVLDHLVDEVDAILLEPATELDHNRALEVAIVHVEKVDKLQMMAIARRNSAIHQLEGYREGIGHRLRELCQSSYQQDPGQAALEAFLDEVERERDVGRQDITQTETPNSSSGSGDDLQNRRDQKFG